ncbi:MAG: gntr domain-containing [Beijerinckiaceae bacterium]|nr:MAG: gntr domain-containing [Beijerinckiaceae bacterium]
MNDEAFVRPPRAGSDSLFGQVTHRLAVAIVSGALPAGALVPNEDDLRAEISASRTAYREAIRFLAGKGLIEAKPRSGTRVAPRAAWHLLDPDVLRWSLSSAANEGFIRDLFELRGLVEPGCAKIAALRRTSAHLARIEEALEGMRVSPPYTEEAMRYDLAFHDAIFDAAGNAAIAALKDVVVTTLLWSLRIQTERTLESFSIPLSDHRRLYEAIARQDGDMAEMTSRILVADALRDTLSAFLKSKGVPAPGLGEKPKATELAVK